MIRREARLEIRTPEGVTFSLLLAGPVTRWLAVTLDVFSVAAVMELLSKLLQAGQLINPDLSAALRTLLYFVLSTGYSIAAEWLWRGQTVGKRLLRLRVIDAQCMRLQFSQVLVRNILRAVDALPVFYLVGGISVMLSQRAQRLGDLAANTVVIRTVALRPPDIDRLFAGKFNSLIQYPHLAARLRQRVRPEIASAALQALLRRDGFEPQARLELFAELARHFRRVVEFPAEATEQLADEQYVRNVVEILYRTKPVASPPALPDAR